MCILMVLEDNHSLKYSFDLANHFLDSGNTYDEKPYVNLFGVLINQKLMKGFFFFCQGTVFIFQVLAFVTYFIKNQHFLFEQFIFNNLKKIQEKHKELIFRQQALMEKSSSKQLSLLRNFPFIIFTKIPFYLYYEIPFTLFSRFPWIVPFFTFQASLAVNGLFGLIYPFSCSYHLLDLFRKFPELQNIIKAIQKPWQQIVLTLVMFCIVTYFFALVYYYDSYSDFDPLCNSIWKCFTWILVQTFQSSSGFMAMYPPDYNDNWEFSLRIIIDFGYIFIVCILITQVLSGTIIDQFAQLREEAQKKLADMNEVCFICGYNVTELERKQNKKNTSFKDHIEKEHSKWNYVNFMQYLNQKKSTEYTGFESYVCEKRKMQDTSWFPICFENEEETQRKDTDEINFENLEQQISLKKKKEMANLSSKWQLLNMKIDENNQTVGQIFKRIETSIELKKKKRHH